uniref:Tubulin tyrosine ligase like 10 n=1 Tax=Leptobrachium leishanense TaxID=445787 RepID=A0A8C5PGQ5_9ANUR
MQLKKSSVSHNVVSPDTLNDVKGQKETEKDGTEEKANGMEEHVNKRENCPEEPKRRKTARKSRKSQELDKPSTDIRSKTPSAAKKNEKYKLRTKGTDSQVSRMPKAEFDPAAPKPLDGPKTAPSTRSQRISPTMPSLGVKKTEECRGYGPYFYIGGNNGEQLVSAYCMKKGWQRIHDSKREDYKLKWCEIKSSAAYSSFREGEQLLYQIPNNKLLTTKIGLLNSLREYERVMLKIGSIGTPRSLKINDFFPETFRLDITSEKESFFSLYEDGQTWICKPTGLNQGRGIFLLKTQEQVTELCCQLQAVNEHVKRPHYKGPQARIVQRYIHNPLLLGGRKFDVRSYLLIASTEPYFVFFRHGYARLTCNYYDPKSDDLTGHLTNQYMQKKHPLYSEMKEETVWSMERFNSYINEIAQDKGLPQDWVLKVFTKRMQQIMTHCFMAVKSKLDCCRGYFDLIGCDFLIDENFKVWLLEMNCNPALNTNCEVLKEVIPDVVDETLDLALELFHKRQKKKTFLPLDTQRRCVLLYNGQLNEQTVKYNWATNINPVKIEKELPLETLNKPVKNMENTPQVLKAPVRNGVIKPVIPKVIPKTTPTVAAVQIVNIPHNNLPYVTKHNPKNETTNGRTDTLKHNVEPSDGEQAKETPLQSAPVARFSFSNLQKLRVTGSKTPQNMKKRLVHI